MVVDFFAKEVTKGIILSNFIGQEFMQVHLQGLVRMGKLGILYI